MADIQSTLSPSHPYFSLVNKIQNNRTAFRFFIDLVLTNSLHDNFNLHIKHITELNIIQQFMENYSDVIMLSILVTRNQYVNIVKNYTDLMCTLVIDYNNGSDVSKNTNFVNMKYHVVLTSIMDLNKNVENAELEENDSLYPINIQLIHPYSYAFNKHQFYFNISDNKIESALWLLCKSLNISRLYLEPPHNKKEYSNIVLEPMYTVTGALERLQKKYGIYEQGVCSYIDHSGMYIYPKYEFLGNGLSTTHFYKLNDGIFTGNGSTIGIEDNNLHVLVTTHVNIETVSYLEKERVGTRYVVVNTDTLMDGWVEHREEETIIGENNVKVFELLLKSGIKDHAGIPMYSKIKNNPFNISESVAHLYVDKLTFTLMGIPPWLIKPFGKLKYHYLHKDEEKTVSGTPTSMVYTLKKQQVDKNWFYSTCNLTMQTQTMSDEILTKKG